MSCPVLIKTSISNLNKHHSSRAARARIRLPSHSYRISTFTPMHFDLCPKIGQELFRFLPNFFHVFFMFYYFLLIFCQNFTFRALPMRFFANFAAEFARNSG